MKRIVAICLCLVISSVCRAQVGYQGQSAISLGVAKTNYGVMADLRFMNQVTPRSAIGGEVVYNREQLSTTDDADFNAQQVLVGVVSGIVRPTRVLPLGVVPDRGRVR